MKSKRTNIAEGDEEEEEEDEEGKGPAVATTAADSSALAMVRIETFFSGRAVEMFFSSARIGRTLSLLQSHGNPPVPRWWCYLSSRCIPIWRPAFDNTPGISVIYSARSDVERHGTVIPVPRSRVVRNLVAVGAVASPS